MAARFLAAECGGNGPESGVPSWTVVIPGRFERPTCCSGGNRSIQLSYGIKKETQLADGS